jgi:hypothetical protein
MLDERLLDDPDQLAGRDASAGGGLRAAASAGAQIRATVEAAGEAGVESLAGTRPRALVVVNRPGVGASVTALLTALLPACPVPVVVTDAVPQWIGPLDIVLAHSDDPGDHELAESIDRARRYGATVVVTARADGPVAAAAAGTMLLVPRVEVPPGFAFPRAFTAGLVLLNTLSLTSVDLGLLADELDREAERDHASYESFVNPAKSLSLRLADRTPLLCGLDPVATAVATHATEALACFAGMVAGASAYPQLLTRTALHRAAVRTGSADDIFADPQDTPLGGLRLLLLAVEDGPLAAATRQTAVDSLPGADLLTAEETTAGDAVRAAVLALRFELASVYLGLAMGTLGGPGLTVSIPA